MAGLTFEPPKAWVYVAGPYTHPEPIENTHNAIAVADAVANLGYAVYCPHLTLLWHLHTPHREEFWYDNGFYWLRRCNYLLRIPGPSYGSDLEEELAKQLFIPVVHTIDELEELYEKRVAEKAVSTKG